MSDYSEAKFSSLNFERQAQICLDLIYNIEENWDELKLRVEQLSLLKKYFDWSDFNQSEDVGLKKINQMRENIKVEMTERALLDFAVLLERFLGRSLKDDQMIKITFKDDLKKQRKLFPIYFVLDHLRSSFNVGSIFRMAECLGVSHIYLVGYTPTPEDAGVSKTAMGTQKMVSWSKHNFMKDVIVELKEKKVHLIGLETAEHAKSILDVDAKESMALFVGNERFGISKETLLQLDECVVIPMMGSKNSLNVAHSLSIATFEMTRKLQ